MTYLCCAGVLGLLNLFVYLIMDQGAVTSHPLKFLTIAACWQVANLPSLTGGSIGDFCATNFPALVIRLPIISQLYRVQHVFQYIYVLECL